MIIKGCVLSFGSHIIDVYIDPLQVLISEVSWLLYSSYISIAALLIYSSIVLGLSYGIYALLF